MCDEERLSAYGADSIGVLLSVHYTILTNEHYEEKRSLMHLERYLHAVRVSDAARTLHSLNL